MAKPSKYDQWKAFKNQQYRDMYQFKLDLGLCIEGGCANETDGMARCEHHRKKALESYLRVKAGKKTHVGWKPKR